MAIVKITESILEILRCSVCREKFFPDHENITCKNCGHAYPLNNGIPDLMPPIPIRLPEIYNDPDYKEFYKRLASIREGFRKPGVISWGQDAGHWAVKKLMSSKQYNIILDIGCGEGGHFPFLNSSSNVIGIDVDQESLERLKKNFPDFFVIRADSYNLPFENESVGCIMSIYNLEHLAYLDLALEEMHRVISPEGDIFISVPNEGGFLFVLGRSLTTARKFSTDSFNYGRAAEIEHLNCIWQLERAFKRYFVIKKKDNFPFPAPLFHLNLITTYHCKKN